MDGKPFYVKNCKKYVFVIKTSACGSDDAVHEIWKSADREKIEHLIFNEIC